MSSFWLILKQQWTIEEISIFSNSSHLWMEGGAVWHNLERDPPRDHHCQVWFNLVHRFQAAVKIWAHFDLYYRYSQQWTIKISSPLFSIFSLAAILVESRDQRTQFWKRAIQIPFLQSLVAIGPVVSEEKIKVYDVRRRTPSDGKSSRGLWPGEIKKGTLDSQPQVIKLISCLLMVAGSLRVLRLLPPLKLVALT